MKLTDLPWLVKIAEAISEKSKDPSTKVGCLIIDKESRIISSGYNGFVSGCDESLMTQDKPLKHHLVIHAELNAILFSTQHNLKDHIAITTHAPCDNCLKHLLQKGIREIYFKSEDPISQRGSDDQKEAIVRLIKSTGAKVLKIDGTPYSEFLNIKIES